ncbi:MAG TPA: hypothetical protein ENH55_01075 [Aurantimonas coralicida]|uniref:Uncharacterized protein n=2 Tax=root TaxID=1 RepID=A0A9C9NK67_9HYPH|nr:hypothetical protein [Aurantimonas coralicida]HEU03086.1 hypothetical protein [Aurantimonas coralicida]
MPDLDTDPSMMREQQDLDTPQSIGTDTSPARESSDSDAGSRADREAAKAGLAARPKEMTPRTDRGDGPAQAAGRYDIALMRKAALARGASLVRKGRSLLGN